MMIWINEEAPLLKAWFILMLVLILPNLIFKDPNIQAQSYSILDYILSAILLFFILVCVRYIRGKKVEVNKPPYGEINLNTWGYIWRTFVAYIFNMVFVLGAVYLFTGETNPLGSIFNQILIILATPFVIWVLFCKERINFIKKAIMYLRGMPI